MLFRSEEKRAAKFDGRIPPLRRSPHPPKLPKYQPTDSERYDPIQSKARKETCPPRPRSIHPDPDRPQNLPYSLPGPAVGPYCRGPNAAGRGGGLFVVPLGRSIDVSIRGPREPRRRRGTKAACSGTGCLPARRQSGPRRPSGGARWTDDRQCA